MTVPVKANGAQLDMPRGLCLALGTGDGEPWLAVEPLRPADLLPLAGEVWLNECLRRGWPRLPLADLPMRVQPRRSVESRSRIAGLDFHLRLPDGRARSCFFGIQSLEYSAQAAASKLVAGRRLGENQPYFYELVVENDAGPSQPPAPQSQMSGRAATAATVRYVPLTFLEIPLQPLIAEARGVAFAESGVMPLFFTEEAWSRAECFSRRGAAQQPPLESGGVLLGSLAACPQTAEFFAIVTDVLEVRDALQTASRLDYSVQSWNHIEECCRARQAARPSLAERILGQCHGHPFLPCGHRCQDCAERDACALTSAWMSPADVAWMNAVFARQPWAVSQIYGYSARNEPVAGVFTRRHGQWRRPGYYVLQSFNP